MKVTCINESARNNGSCAHLIDNFINGIAENNADVITYCAGEANIHFCKGCKKCYVDGTCVQDTTFKK